MKKERDKKFSFYKESNFLRFKQFYLERDILRVAFYMFDAEKKMKKNSLEKKITIPMSQQTFKRVNVKKLKKVLEELFLLILLEDIKINIKPIEDIKGRVRKEKKFPKKEAIILFSGGIDSYAGIKIAEKEYNNLLAVFVAHSDQKRIIKIVQKVKRFVSTKIRTVYAPGMGIFGYSQLRGFLYMLSGGMYANLCKACKILVTECGPTMYQPSFSPYDSITYTTHPYVLKAAKEVLEILLGYKIKIIIPFENLTKAEIISNSGIEDFSITHSCISQRFGNHDGTCFGCVIRRLACKVSNVKDVVYNKDVFQEDANQDNLMNILVFSRDLLSNYDSMPDFEIDKIDEFHKYNMFERYALDNLAGLMLNLKGKNNFFKKFIISSKTIQDRILRVRENRIKPDFKKYVN